SASSIDCRIRSRRSSIIFWIGPNAYRFSTKSVIRKQTIVQIISPGVTEMSGFVASGMALDEDVGEDRAEEAVEDDGLGQREAEPLDPLQLASKLGLPGDRLDHRAEDVADADAGAEGAEADAEREADRLTGVRDRRIRRSAEKQVVHACSLVVWLDRRAYVDGGQGSEDEGLDADDDDHL